MLGTLFDLKQICHKTLFTNNKLFLRAKGDGFILGIKIFPAYPVDVLLVKPRVIMSRIETLCCVITLRATIGSSRYAGTGGNWVGGIKL